MLAEFQNALLEALYCAENNNPEVILRDVRRHESAAVFIDWLNNCDPLMLTVASTLTKKWGIPTPKKTY